MNNEFCCFDCATNAMSAEAPESTTPIVRMVNGVCPVCGSDEPIDLSNNSR